MRKLITNYELSINDFKRAIKTFVLICALFPCAKNSFAQTNFDALNESIRRGNNEQKRDALFQIRNTGTTEASRVAIPALSDKSEIIRATAAFSVVFLPPDESLNVLLPLLKDKKELVRREAVAALGKTRNANAVSTIVQIFQTDKKRDVKNACVVALGEIGDASAIEVLTSILLPKKLKAEEEFTRRSAARSIGQIAQILQTNKTQILTPEDFLPDKYKETEKPQHTNMTKAFPVFRAAQNVLIQTLQNTGETTDVKREAAFALGAIGDQAAIPILQANLNAEDYYLAQICTEALRKIAFYSNAKVAE